MASVSLTKMHGWNNFFFTLLDVPALSLADEEVEGCGFGSGGSPSPDHSLPRWQGGASEEEQPNRLLPLPDEDPLPLEPVTHAVNASPIRSMHTTALVDVIPTAERVVLTVDRGASPSRQLAHKLFADFRLASAEEAVSVTGSMLLLRTLNVVNVISGVQSPTAFVSMHCWNRVKTTYAPSQEFVCWDRLRLDELDFNCRGAPLGTLEDLGRDWPWQKQCSATSPFLLVVAMT
jgi:hypothetical protein